MQAKSLGLQILWWAEVVASARAILFFAPVMISRGRAQGLSFSPLEDGFLWIATFASLLWLLIGIASLLGHRFWRFFHALAMAVILALTFALWNAGRQLGVSWPLIYWVPAGCSIIFTLWAHGRISKPQRG